MMCSRSLPRLSMAALARSLSCPRPLVNASIIPCRPRMKPPVGKSGPGTISRILDSGVCGFWMSAMVALTISVRLCGGMLGGARGGAFEEHVLDEVGDAIQVERLVAGAGGDPDAHGDGTDLGDRLGENEQAVAQASPANAAGGGWGGGQNGGGFDHAAPCDSLCHKDVSRDAGR